MTGNTSKDSKYRKRLIAAVRNDQSHPFNQGIHMEAHHLVSAEGVEISELGELLEDRNYDINLLGNLAFFPATLPGACHLEVQLHRGNHFGYATEQAMDDDECHPESYHITVRDALLGIEEDLRECKKDCETSQKKVQDMVDDKSREILRAIARFRVPLSPISHSFRSKHPVGCGNCIDVLEHETKNSYCESDRDHENQAHPKFKNGNLMQTITRPKGQAYTLKVGK